jgi:hypothetical protein
MAGNDFLMGLAIEKHLLIEYQISARVALCSRFVFIFTFKLIKNRENLKIFVQLWYIK